MKKEKKREYTGKDVKVLRDAAHVRKRPGMYIGDTGKRGLHQLVWETVDNSIDEAMMGNCSNIEIALIGKSKISVTDDGRGIPVDLHPTEKRPTLEVVMTMIGAGGKFDSNAYQSSGGLHGIGVSAVCALSKLLTVSVKRDGKLYRQHFSRGKATSELQELGKVKDHGTRVEFEPDSKIFGAAEFDPNAIKSRARELAFLNPGLSVSFVHGGKRTVYSYKLGLKSFVSFLNRKKETLHNVVRTTKTEKDVVVDLALQYNSSYNEEVLSFVNTVKTIDGGTHLSGFKHALSRSLLSYIKREKLGGKAKIGADDIREGLTAVVSVRVPNPQFEGQTKTRLGNREVRTIVSRVAGSAISEYLEENKKIARAIANKIVRAAQAREAAKKARDLSRNKQSGSHVDIVKLADCTSRNIDENEIFLLEGQSASGSAKQGRDRRTQAILPLRGKVLNVEKATVMKALANEELKTLIAVMGTGIGDSFDLKKLRYGKIIIMTDADVDGLHIASLLLTFLYRQFPQLITNGNIYIAQPPLYLVKYRKHVKYLRTEKEMKRLKEKWSKKFGVEESKLFVQRYKGLGEMNPEQLHETTMRVDKRSLKQVVIGDAVKANKLFSLLMGDKVDPRRRFIMKHAKRVEV